MEYITSRAAASQANVKFQRTITFNGKLMVGSPSISSVSIKLWDNSTGAYYPTQHVTLYAGSNSSGTVIGTATMDYSQAGQYISVSGGNLNAIKQVEGIYACSASNDSYPSVKLSIQVKVVYTAPTLVWTTNPALSFSRSGNVVTITKTAGVAKYSDGSTPDVKYILNTSPVTSAYNFTNNVVQYTVSTEKDANLYFNVTAKSEWNTDISSSPSSNFSYHYIVPDTLKYYGSNSWIDCIPCYYNGSSFKECYIYRYNGTSWEQCSQR